MNWFKKMLASIATHPVGWRIIFPLAKAVNFMYAHRQNYLNRQNEVAREEKLKQLATVLFPERKVKHGPFKGLQYPSFEAKGSALLPKLLGTYEAELHEIVEQICNRKYSEIINIGCGEGYYAIGLAKRIPTCKIFAFDVNEEAQQLTTAMATLNGCNTRVIVGAACTHEFISTFKFSGRGLIVCDAEGAEKDLFQTNTLNLTNCDLLIEIHDFIDMSISSNLHSLFNSTHTVQSILSIDDLHKPRTYIKTRPELTGFSLQERHEMLREGRPTIMEWLYMESKQPHL